MYYELRALEPARLSAVERAARFVYLNQYCFNGVYRENRAGRFNVPRGRKFRGIPDEDAYLEFAERLTSVKLRCADFVDALKDAGKDDFVYLDPPYAKRGARNRGEYGREAFETDDVVRLIDTMTALDRAGAYVMTSFFDSRRLRRSLMGWNFRRIGVARSVSGFIGQRRTVQELLVRNYTCDGTRG